MNEHGTVSRRAKLPVSGPSRFVAGVVGATAPRAFAMVFRKGLRCHDGHGTAFCIISMTITIPTIHWLLQIRRVGPLLRFLRISLLLTLVVAGLVHWRMPSPGVEGPQRWWHVLDGMQMPHVPRWVETVRLLRSHARTTKSVGSERVLESLGQTSNY